MRCSLYFDKLRVIEATGVLWVDLSWLNGNYQRALFHQARKTSVTRLRVVAESRRHAALVCFLWQSYRDAVDQTVDMFDELLTRAHTQAQNELDEQFCSQRQTIQASLTALRSLGRIILAERAGALGAALPPDFMLVCVAVGIRSAHPLVACAARSLANRRKIRYPNCRRSLDRERNVPDSMV
jgi:hypothetical protein